MNHSNSLPLTPNKHSISTEPQSALWESSQARDLSYEEMVKELYRQTCQLERAQTEKEERYKRCIDHLMAEIDKNEAINSRLAAQVLQLRSELSQGRKDILLIDTFVKTNLRLQVRSPLVKRQAEERGSNRDLLPSCSKQRSPKYIRPASKLFKSKISINY